MFPVKDQGLELARLVTLERIRLRVADQSDADNLIEQSLETDTAKRIAKALYGKLDPAALDPSERRYLQQVKALAGKPDQKSDS